MHLIEHNGKFFVMGLPGGGYKAFPTRQEAQAYILAHRGPLD